MFLEYSQPARGMACYRHGFVVDCRVPVIRLSADQQEDCFEDLVCDGDNGSFMASSQTQRLELGLEGALVRLAA